MALNKRVNRPWTPAEEGVVRARYPLEGAAAVAQALGRTPMAVQTRANDLGLRAILTRGTRWSPELDEVVTLMYPVALAADISALIGCSVGSVYQRAEKLGLSKPEGWAREARLRVAALMTAFTPEVAAVIRQRYPTTAAADLARELGLNKGTLQKWAALHGIKKDPKWVADTARDRSARPDHPMQRYRFPKGNVPANKGVKGISYPGMEATQFQKGARPGNWLPVGSYRINSEGYLDRKVTDTGYPPADWKGVHRLLWEELRGPIPAGHVVCFKDGKPITDLALLTIDKLECISKADRARRNMWHRDMPPELRKLVGTRIALTRTLNRRQREVTEAP